MRRAAVVTLLVACGRIGFDPLNDGGGDAVAVTCWPQWHAHAIAPTTPAQIVELAYTDIQGDPSFADNDLRIYLRRTNGAAGMDIYTSTRVARGMPWTTPVPVTELNSTTDDTRFSVTADDLFGVFHSFRSGTYDLWATQRASLGDPFGMIAEDPLLTAVEMPTTGGVFDPELRPDGLVLYDSPSVGPGQQTIARASRSSLASPFSASQAMHELDIGSPPGAADPSISPDELVIVYSGTLDNSMLPTDLYYATRETPDAPFGTPELVPVVNTTFDEADPEVSQDGCELFFRTNRISIDDIFVTTIQ